MILIDLEDEEQKVYRNKLVEIATDLSIKHDLLLSIIDSNFDDFKDRTEYVPFYRNVLKEGIKVYEYQ